MFGSSEPAFVAVMFNTSRMEFRATQRDDAGTPHVLAKLAPGVLTAATEGELDLFAKQIRAGHVLVLMLDGLADSRVAYSEYKPPTRAVAEDRCYGGGRPGPRKKTDGAQPDGRLDPFEG